MNTSHKPRYVQRDLEDQIFEEKHNVQDKNFSHLKTNQKTESMTDTAQATVAAKPQIKISEVLALLGKGYSRLEKSNKQGIGSIQSYFKLAASQVKDLFEHPKLKGRKSKPAPVDIIDDAEGVEPIQIKQKAKVAAKPAAATANAAVATDADLFK